MCGFTASVKSETGVYSSLRPVSTTMSPRIRITRTIPAISIMVGPPRVLVGDLGLLGKDHPQATETRELCEYLMNEADPESSAPR